MEVKLKAGGYVYRVNIIESERGWGSKISVVKYFTDMEEALNFVKEYNSKNNLPSVPDYYTRAEYVGQTILQEVVKSNVENRKRNRSKTKVSK